MASSLVDRMKLMLSTGDGADVHFLVGKEMELLPAHKQILKHASVVFEAMFRFDSQNGKSENASADITVTKVPLPDVEPAAFKVMLNFIYTEDLSELNGHNAMAVLYAANKYNIALLLKAFLDFPINELPNVFLAYGRACFLNQNEFAHRCLGYICRNAGSLFRSEEFLQIDQNILDEILEQKCRQNAIECSAANRRSALGPALFKIRFPLIPQREFSKNIVSSGVLTVEEFVGVYQFHSHPNLRGVPGLYPLKFPSHARISDWNIPMGNRGTLAMEIEKLSEFAREEWEGRGSIRTKKDSAEKWLGFFLKCAASTEGDENFYSIKMGCGFPGFITFEQLMDPSRGLYDKNEDKVTLAIDIAVENKNSLKFDSGPNKSNGKIMMEIGNLSEFAREIFLSERSSEPVKINGLPWKILTLITMKNDSTEKGLGFYLRCTAPREDENWDCLCSATFRIVSQKSETEDLIGKFNNYILNNKTSVKGFSNLITFSDLMDPSRGFYEKEEDKVTLAIDVILKEKNAENFDYSNSNKSTGKIVMEIDKLSEFAREICGSEWSSETAKIKGLPWKILAEIKEEKDGTKKCLGFFLSCTASEDNWDCLCSATFRIVSQKGGTEDLIGKFNNRIFNNKTPVRGFNNFITFSDLVDEDKRLYDKNEDKMTLAIDVIVKEQKADKLDYSNPNKSVGKIVMEIGKLLEFAREICGSERSSEIKQIKGFQWKVSAILSTEEGTAEKCLVFYLLCAAPTKDESWSCKGTATLRIVSKKGEAENFTGKLNDQIFNNKLAHFSIGYITFTVSEND
ncbi:hypothetical protein niasHT_032721 [Heterodera trifolii]|uniref:BTB domain-containing protein n=1 Tax=Heterodera trifolii TaxID=157864 RepID=A0ABD2IM10_9BILA